MRISLTPLIAAFASVLCCLSLSSCATTDPYSYDPEGTSYSTVPFGYTALMVGGISYWHYDDHYCRHWPDRGYVVVPSPHGRPPYHRPPAYRPPGNKPGGPVHRPGPSYPGYKPGGSRPSIQPVNRPTRDLPGVKPQLSPGGFSLGGGGMRGGGGRGGRGR